MMDKYETMVASIQPGTFSIPNTSKYNKYIKTDNLGLYLDDPSNYYNVDVHVTNYRLLDNAVGGINATINNIFDGLGIPPGENVAKYLEDIVINGNHYHTLNNKPQRKPAWYAPTAYPTENEVAVDNGHAPIMYLRAVYDDHHNPTPSWILESTTLSNTDSTSGNFVTGVTVYNAIQDQDWTFNGNITFNGNKVTFTKNVQDLNISANNVRFTSDITNLNIDAKNTTFTNKVTFSSQSNVKFEGHIDMGDNVGINVTAGNAYGLIPEKGGSSAYSVGVVKFNDVMKAIAPLEIANSSETDTSRTPKYYLVGSNVVSTNSTSNTPLMGSYTSKSVYIETSTMAGSHVSPRYRTALRCDDILPVNITESTIGDSTTHWNQAYIDNIDAKNIHTTTLNATTINSTSLTVNNITVNNITYPNGEEFKPGSGEDGTSGIGISYHNNGGESLYSIHPLIYLTNPHANVNDSDPLNPTRTSQYSTTTYQITTAESNPGIGYQPGNGRLYATGVYANGMTSKQIILRERAELIVGVNGKITLNNNSSITLGVNGKITLNNNSSITQGSNSTFKLGAGFINRLTVSSANNSPSTANSLGYRMVRNTILISEANFSSVYGTNGSKGVSSDIGDPVTTFNKDQINGPYQTTTAYAGDSIHVYSN